MLGAWCPERLKKGVRSPGSVVTVLQVLGIQTQVLWKNTVPLTIEASLQPQLGLLVDQLLLSSQLIIETDIPTLPPEIRTSVPSTSQQVGTRPFTPWHFLYFEYRKGQIAHGSLMSGKEPVTGSPDDMNTEHFTESYSSGATTKAREIPCRK